MSWRLLETDDARLGRIWLSAMPGRFEPFAAFVERAERERLALVLCLTPLHELQQLSPVYAAAATAGTLPCRWQQVPMRDLGLAPRLADFRRGIELACDTVRAGDAVLLHCAAGIGRTGTAAACLLKHLGQPTPVALQRVRDAGSNPESALQSGLVEKF